MERWYVVSLSPGKGNIYRAITSLELINCSSFSPLIRVHRARADRPGKFRQFIEALFPGYLFVFFDPEVVHTSLVERCPGISHLLRTGGCIIPVRDNVVDEIMSLPICQQSAMKIPRSRKSRSDVAQRLQIARQLDEVANESDISSRSALFLAFLSSLQ